MPAQSLTVPTLADLFTLYTAEYLPQQAPTTQALKRGVLRQVLHDLGPVLLTDLTPARLRAWRDTLSQRVQPQSVTTYLRALSAVLTVAVDDYEWLPENPLRKVRKPALPPHRVRWLTQEEQGRLLRACEQSSCAMLYPVVLMALTSGARKLEILLRRWSDVDWEQGLLRLVHSKNKERRTIHMPQSTLVVLRGWQSRQMPGSPWLFPGERTGRPPARIRRPWTQAVHQAGLHDFHFHDLRHTTASYLAMQGCTLLEIGAVLGHTSLTSTKRYAHLSPSHTAALVERMAQAFIGMERNGEDVCSS